jgi:WD40 repeat protein
MEKEFKSKMPHTGKICCITKLNDSEFMSCS